MKHIKDQLRQVKRDLRKSTRINAQAKAEARRIIERDEWKSFKAECTLLRVVKTSTTF